MKRSRQQLEWRRVLIGALLVLGGATSAWAQNVFPSSGNAGIGTTTPISTIGTVLHIYNSANTGTVTSNVSLVLDSVNRNAVIALRGSGTAFNGLQFQSAVGTFLGDISYNYPNNAIFFRTNGNNERMRITSSGNVGIGTMSPTTRLHVAGDVQVDGNMAAKYQDVAEWVRTLSPLSPGTVVVIDPHRHNQILQASQSYDMLVAGVVSAKPGLLLGEAGEDKVKVAQSGRVKVKVDATYGPIATGDLLVTSPTPGHAMRSTPVDLGGTFFHRPGTLLGKALEQLEEGRGEILVLLTLQ